MKTILYDIFLQPLADNYITSQLEKGKQNTTGSVLHKHSMGVTPKFAFATLLLTATGNRQGESPPSAPDQISRNSRNIHKRLCQVAADYDIPTRNTALTFNFGHNYQYLAPAFMAELKRIQSIPWPIIINEQEQSLTNSR